MSGPDLERLRERIHEIDQRILELARERVECAREIGRAKLRSGRPVRDHGRERIVLERAGSVCAELGLPPELGEGVLQVLIDEAVRAQEELREAIGPVAPGRAVVVGGGGGMGGWLCRYLRAQGHAVTVVDPAGGPAGFPVAATLAAAWPAADVVVLAVPLHAGPDAWDEVLALPAGPLVFDVFSLKSTVTGRIRLAVEAGHVAASVHPMFGPAARLLSGRALVLCDTGCPAATERVRELFDATSLHLVDVPLDEHDRRMADVLGLSHAVSLLYARALAASPLDPRAMAETASTTFRKQLRTTAEVAAENPALYYEIQRGNPHAPEALERLARELAALHREIVEDRREDFVTAMLGARERLDAIARAMAPDETAP